ncbi:hypothetical protein [Vibrio sagamiensis]|uniref:hypothetical protein n=1 Tax=Vibrio sagamiensis TaxID=512650 RepID=UPI000586BD2C|nr:hypothetical protein [Vibrio sagamiensis]PNQ54318.1 hypothetical protein C1141_16505 [Vibrio agarivorans]
MMKKILVLATLLPGLSMAKGQMEGLEVGMAMDQGLSVVIEANDQYRGTVGNDGIAFDYIALRGSFANKMPFTWYVGAGAWNEWDDGFGLRAPLGLDWNFAKQWNLYGQVHPELDLNDDLDLHIGAAVGITYGF